MSTAHAAAPFAEVPPHDEYDQPVLLLLSATSGAVDGFTLVCLGKVFASVMTGNMVLIGASVLTGDASVARHALVALAAFAAGATTAGLLRGRVPAHMLVAAEAVLLLLPAGVWAAGLADSEVARGALVGVAAFLMGVRAGTWGTPTTYFTGTLARVAKRAGLGALARDDAWAFARLAAVVGGAAATAAVARGWSSAAGFVPVALTVVAACAAALRRRRTPPASGADVPSAPA
ncbi:DUF1275 family protein [Yinghuangia seranimata]|uniref:DUF1275 family protein n=1 Tax=Yinghuangia seranimata TaxID=408067 RepID=UPI00248CC5B9|nr:DUF1275 family protein [Yinghuangia seranimata]MDI2125336.1 DUF1275 family protein [Yinghuangia seranimata]